MRKMRSGQWTGVCGLLAANFSAAAKTPGPCGPGVVIVIDSDNYFLNWIFVYLSGTLMLVAFM
jgi:hypothetical protein